MPKISLAKTADGNVEIFKDGKRVSTVSATSAEQQARAMGGDFIGFAPAPAPGMLQTTKASRTQEKRNGTTLDNRVSNIDTLRANQDASKFAQDTIDAQTKNNDAAKNNDTPIVDPQITAANDKHTADINAANSQLESSKILLNSSNQALIDNIKNIYENRLAMMKVSNEALMGTVNQSGIRSGRARYLPKTQAGILSDEESKGLLRMGQLQGEMLSLISQAENARTKGEFKLLNDNMVAIDKIDSQLQDTVQGIQRLAIQKQTEQRLRDKLEFDQQQTDIKTGLKNSERSAPVMAKAFSELKTPEEQASYVEAVSKSMGVDPGVVLGDIVKETQKAGKASMDVKNVESLINNRKRQTDISAYRAETARITAEEGKTTSGYSIGTENIINGVSILSDISDKNKEKVKSELKSLDFYEDIPPKWFVDYQNSTVDNPLKPSDMKEEWKKYKDRVLKDNGKSI